MLKPKIIKGILRCAAPFNEMGNFIYKYFASFDFSIFPCGLLLGSENIGDGSFLFRWGIFIVGEC